MKCLKYFISNVEYIFTCHLVFVETALRPRKNISSDEAADTCVILHGSSNILNTRLQAASPFS